MGEQVTTEYIVPRKVFDLLINDGFLNDYKNYINYDIYCTDLVRINLEIALGQDEDLEEFFEFLEIPYDLEWEGDYDLNAGRKEVRFEIDKENGIAIRREADWDKGYRYAVDAKEILESLDSGDSKEAIELLVKKINDNTSECNINNANTPSEERLMFLAAKNKYNDLFEVLYQDGVSLNYKDKKSGMTTYKIICETNSELSSMVKKDLLIKQQEKNRSYHNDAAFSL